MYRRILVPWDMARRSGGFSMGKFLRARAVLLPGAVATVLVLASCQGEQGAAGPQGPKGDQGLAGLPGPPASVGPIFHAEGSNTWIVGGYGDNFIYDGSGYERVNGYITIDVDDETNTGLVVSEWRVDDWKYSDSEPPASGWMKVVWTEFAGPADFMDGGIASDLFLHGDSGQEAPVLPTVYTYSGAWGRADIYLNDEKIYDDVEAHYMVTEGTRHPVTHAVHKKDGVGLFAPAPMGGDPGDGLTYPQRVLTHLVVHTDVRDPNNFPPFTMFMHINFENTSISNVTRS